MRQRQGNLGPQEAGAQDGIRRQCICDRYLRRRRTEEQAAEVENLLHKENKEMEINVIDGGQPVYYYIISVE